MKFKKSSFCNGGSCVLVGAHQQDLVLIRDSKAKRDVALSGLAYRKFVEWTKNV